MEVYLGNGTYLEIEQSSINEDSISVSTEIPGCGDVSFSIKKEKVAELIKVLEEVIS